MWPFKRKQSEVPAKARIEPKLNNTIKKRGFDASVISRLTNDWTSSPPHIDQVLFANLRTLVARSRERYLNDDYARRFVSLVKTHVVGHQGFNLESLAVGNDGKPDPVAAAAIENVFKQFRKRTICDLHGILPFNEITRLVVGSIVIDGEALIRYHDAGAQGIQIELIDSQRLDINHNEQLGSGRYIRFGIEYGEDGRVQAYHLLRHRGDSHLYGGTHYQSRDYERVPAQQMDHIFVPIITEQRRGLPWMATSLLRMKMLGGFEDAALVAARAGASKMGFFKTQTGDDYQGSGKDSLGAVISDFEAGTFEQLPEGVEVQSFDPSYPSGEFDMFMKSCLRGIASGLGVDYVSLANNLEGVNYSSIRHGELLNRELWKALQEWLVENWLTDFYSRWLTEQYLRQGISIKGRPLARKLVNYLPHRWQGRRWDWVDPQKDMSAKILEYKLGVTSISQIIRERGRDPEDVWREREAENKRMKELGIEPGVMLGFVVSDGQNSGTDSNADTTNNANGN